MTTQELDRQFIAPTYGRFPVTLVKGQGALFTDENGKQYIDMGSGIAVSTFGACDPIWVEAVTRQANTLGHTSNLYYTQPQTRLAEMLCQRTGMQKVFFSNSGAEANECALKVARKWGEEHGGRQVIVTLKNSFHGRTIATLAATGQAVFHQHFGPFPEGFRHVTPGDQEELKQVLAQPDVCAVLMEPIQGEGGVEPLPPEYMKLAEQLCREHQLLLMLDEVQTGNGRTGNLFAYMHFGLHPDVVTTAKGLAGGLPLGATLLGPQVASVLGKGDHGSTFGGNPICAAGACSILERLDDPLFQEVQAKSQEIQTALAGHPMVKRVSGMGLMLGIATVRPAAEVAQSCLEHGLLVLTAKDRVRLLPPLNISWELLREGIAILKQNLSYTPCATQA